MKTKLLDLGRSLFEVAGTDWSDTSFNRARAFDTLLTWSDVLKTKCAVLVGSANAGKTSEIRLQAEALRAAKGHACFVAVRELLVAGSLEDALDPDEAAALCAWLKTPGEQLHLFIDAIDEATLTGPRDLRTCLRKLVAKVSVAPENVTWVLSTRPAVLSQEVLDAIDGALGVTLSRIAPPTNGASIIDAHDSKATEEPAATANKSTAKVFRLAPLTRSQAKVFLEVAVGLPNATAVMDAADDRGLGHLLRSPGKCKLLAQMDLIGNPPVSLERTYSRSVALHLNAPTSGRAQALKTSKEQLETEATRLAAASTLCERLNIELPSENESPSPQALSARAIVRGLLDSGLQYLLSSDFFEESGHHQVKIQPDDIRYYLAAKRLSALVQGREDARKVAQVLGWRAPTGECGIFIHFIPVAGWLATLNHYFRPECLELEPQCVAFFGDLHHLPLADAQRALTAAVGTIAAGQRIGRGGYSLTSENYWQAGRPDLLPHISRLFDEHIDHEEARELLLAIARSVRSPVLREKVLAWAHNSYQRVVEDADLLRYFLAVGNATDKAHLRSATLKTTNLSERSLRALLKHSAWSTLNATDIAELVQSAMKDDEHKFTLRYALSHEVGPTATTAQLQELSQRLLGLVTDTLPVDDENFAPQKPLKRVKWLAEVVADLLVELGRRSHTGTSLKNAASLLVRFKTKVLDKDATSQVDCKTLRKLLEPASPLRDLVVQQLIQHHKSADEKALRRAFLFGQPMVCPTVEEVRASKAKLLTKVLEDHDAALVQGTEQKKQSPSKRPILASVKGLAELRKRSSAIKAGTDIPALSWVAQLLSSTRGLSRYGDVSLDGFGEAYGSELATAVLQGLKALWRTHPPRRDEENPRSTYWSTIAGLQGLHFEFAGAQQPHLTNAEVLRALEYGLYEINGVPNWYWALAKANVKVATKFFRATVRSAHKGAVSAEHSANVLMLLGDAPSEIQQVLAEDAWAAVCAARLDAYQTDNVLSLLVERRIVSVERFSEEAQKRVFSDPENPATLTWAVNWMLLDAAAFMNGLANAREQDKGNLDLLISAVATALDGFRGSSYKELSKQSAVAVGALKELYLELRRIIPPEQDKVYPIGTLHSVDDRERAQRTRDSLPSVLASAHTTAGYLALQELRDAAKTEPERLYFQLLMHQTAEAMQRRPRPMTEEDYLEFERTLRPAPGSLDAFAQQIENDINDVKDIVEKGEFSPRRFLATSVQDVEAGVVKAMEDEFQLYLAGLLAVLGRNRYSVFREPQGSDDSRRDISIALPPQGWKTTLELKVTGGTWTVPDYRDSLRNQLVGLYMRERHTTVGFFVVLLQHRRSWDGPSGTLKFDGLIQLLQQDALQLEKERPELRLRIIGIDATEPLDVNGALIRANAEPKAVKEAKKAEKQQRRAGRLRSSLP